MHEILDMRARAAASQQAPQAGPGGPRGLRKVRRAAARAIPYQGCAYSTPRISLVDPKTTICACPGGTAQDPAVCTAPVGGGVVYPGLVRWVGTGEGYTGYYPATHYPAGLHRYCQGPTSTQTSCIARSPHAPPNARPSRLPSWEPGRAVGLGSGSHMPLGPIKARFHHKYTKVSQ